MTRVFISHSSKNNALATEARDWLARDGHKVFLDYDRHDGIEAGDLWKERLYERLRWADAVVCIVTEDYLVSQWCGIEIAVAQTLGSLLLPLAVEQGVRHPLLDAVQSVAYHGSQRRQAQERICGILREIDAVGGAGWPDDRSPFPGLRPFDVDMHRAFCGRRREVDDLVRLLRSLAERCEGRIVVVVGPSGCGKSSLVRAGLLPAIAREPGWATLTPFAPGLDPVAALSRELAHATRSTPAQIRQRLNQDDGLLLTVEDLLCVGGSPLRRLLVVIDQFEEILTRSPATSRARFADLLGPAVGGPVQVVVTIRSEFLDRLLADPALAALPVHVVSVRPLDTVVLPLVIEGPARLAGLSVDPELVSRMVADTASGDALPLLAFTLDQLATGLSRGAMLSSQRYEQLGGVQGAVTRQADAALAASLAAGGRRRADVLDALLRLVTVDEVGQPTRLEVDYQRLPKPVRVELDAFVAHRLLTSHEREATVSLGVAHEAFLTAWPPFAQAISAAGSALRMRRVLEQAATEWEHAERGSSFLWGSGRLAAAVTETGAQLRRVPSTPQGGGASIIGRLRALRTDREVTSGWVELGPLVRAFLRASIRYQQRRRRLFFTTVAVILVVAVTITSIAVVQRRIAQDQTELATVRELVAQADSLRSSDIRLSLQLGIAAQRIRPSAETRTSLYITLTSTPRITTLSHTSPVEGVAFSPDGRTLATASYDHTAALWDITDRTHPTRTATLTGHTGPVEAVAFSPDGHTLATASWDTTVALWDITDRTHPTCTATLTGHTNTVNGVAFSPDGHTLATASTDHTAALWDITDRTHPTHTATLTGNTNTVTGVAFSPDGHTLATASDDHTAALWDLRRFLKTLDDLIELSCAAAGGGLDRDQWDSVAPGIPYHPTC